MEMGGEGGPCGLAPEGSQGEARDPTGRTTAGTYNDLHMAVRTDRHQAKQDAQELFNALPEDARNSLLGTKTATRTPLKTKPSVQSTGDTAKPDDVDAKEQPTLQDTDGVSMMTCFMHLAIHVLHVKDKTSTPKGSGRPKKPVDPEKVAKVTIIV